jgi:hypothetical protein
LPAIRDDVQQIQLAAERAAGLTRQLLAFARREVVQPRALNLNDVIGRLEQRLAGTLGEQVELSTDLSTGLCPVLTDPGQIEQVLINLAVNARDAMPAGGRLTIHTANADIDGSYAGSRIGLPSGRYATLKVSDSGTGRNAQGSDRPGVRAVLQYQGQGPRIGPGPRPGHRPRHHHPGPRPRAGPLRTRHRHRLHHPAARNQPARR